MKSKLLASVALVGSGMACSRLVEMRLKRLRGMMFPANGVRVYLPCWPDRK